MNPEVGGRCPCDAHRGTVSASAAAWTSLPGAPGLTRSWGQPGRGSSWALLGLTGELPPGSQAPKSFHLAVGALLCDPSTSLWGFTVGWLGANHDGVGGKCGHGHWVMGVLSPRRGPEGRLGLKAGSIGASRHSRPRGEPGSSVSPVGQAVKTRRSI